MRLSIIMPAYNEEKRIGRTLTEYSSFFEKIRNEKILDYEILVVINNTSDKTLEIVEKFSQKNPRIRYLNLKQGGKGFAVVQGFKDSIKRDNDIIGFVDADLATKPKDYYDLVCNLDRYDCVIASRYLKGARVNPRQTTARIIASRVFNFLIRALFLFPFLDTQCGAKVFRRNVLNKFMGSLSLSQWAFDVELLYLTRKNGFRVLEMPTVWSDGKGSKINLFNAGPGMVLGILRLRILHSPFYKIVDLIGTYLFKKVRKPYDVS